MGSCEVYSRPSTSQTLALKGGSSNDDQPQIG